MNDRAEVVLSVVRNMKLEKGEAACERNSCYHQSMFKKPLPLQFVSEVAVVPYRICNNWALLELRFFNSF